MVWRKRTRSEGGQLIDESALLIKEAKPKAIRDTIGRHPDLTWSRSYWLWRFFDENLFWSKGKDLTLSIGFNCEVGVEWNDSVRVSLYPHPFPCPQNIPRDLFVSRDSFPKLPFGATLPKSSTFKLGLLFHHQPCEWGLSLHYHFNFLNILIYI